MHHFNHRGPGSRPRRRFQAGLTLIEFMVSVVIGMLMIAALATLIANQSGTRTEVDRSGRMIENGRYAIQTMISDVQMAGYWGELTDQPAVPGALPNPCSLTVTDLDAARGVPVQGYDAPATLPTALAACVANHKPGTDVLVVRRADPDLTPMLTGTNINLANVVAGQIYLQTGLDTAATTLSRVMAVGSATGADATTFTLRRRDGTVANMRRVLTHIYFISQCSVQASGSCTAGDNGSPIPTLKRYELIVTGGVPAWSLVTLAEGIENLQIDYGVDTDADGGANVYSNGTACPTGDTDCAAKVTALQVTMPFAVTDWANVMSLKVHLLARSTEASPGFADTKSYGMGTAGSVTPATSEQGYKRHAFVQSVRLVNPSARRVL